jgi:ABC-2 type transport system ATP-binding protein
VAAIEVRGLRKSYGDVIAVDGVDLSVEEGEILAFLGPNGAGKTTTIEILEGFRERSAGEVRVLGVDPARAPRQWRERIGIVLQDSEPDGDLTAVETLRLHAAYYSDPRDPFETLSLVGLGAQADQRADKLSGGQQRRLDLALALIGNPELVFLDEPTTGFDPSARRESWEMIESLRALGVTVLLTTHYMDEAQHLADRIAVIAGGVIVAEGTAGELADQVRLSPVVSWDAEELAITDLPPETRVSTVVAEGRTRRVVETENVAAVVGALADAARASGVPLSSLEVRRPSLEETYLRLVAPPADETASQEGRP